MSKRLLRRPEVESRTGLSTSAIYEKMAQSEFPKPIRISKRSVAWIESEVDCFIDQCIEAARGPKALAA